MAKFQALRCGIEDFVITDASRTGVHTCAVVASAEQSWEAMAGFIGDGIERQEQVVLAGLRPDELNGLLRRLREEDGVDPDPAMVDGQLVVMADAAARAFFEMPTAEAVGQLAEQVQRALAAGFRGLRLTGRYTGVGMGPHESALDALVSKVPLSILCPYHRDELTFQEVEQIREVHSSEIPDDSLFDDGSLRITRPRIGWLRLAGRWDANNHTAALSVVEHAAATGARELDMASVRYIDPAGVHALLTGIGPVRLRRPNESVQRLARFLATQSRAGVN